MGGRGRFERISSTSISSGEGGEDFPMTTFLNKTETLIPSNNSTASSSSPAKKGTGRRSMKKRVVSVPIVEIDGSRPKGGGEGAPPSDSWTWRKYGQKPIKGSPYPRGYYRCSSSKGCPARKQVERSRVDPTMLIVTYAAEHNHAWPLPKNRNHHNYQSEPPPPPPPITTQLPASQDTEEEVEVEEELNGSLPQSPTPAATTTTTTNTSTCSVDDTNTTPTFAPDLGEDDSPLMMIEEDLDWRPFMSATSLQSDVAMMMPVSYDDVRKDLSIGDCGGGGDEDEDGSLFAGLGELPECSVVFRSGFPVGAV